MNILRKVSILTSIALLIGVIAFSACKKKKEDPADLGRKAAKEMCKCMSKSTDIGKAACIVEVYDKYEKYEDDEAFEKAFTKEILKCDGLLEWLEGIGTLPTLPPPIRHLLKQ